MDAKFIFQAIRRAHPKAALAPEIVVNDDDQLDRSGYDRAKDEVRQPLYRRIDALMIQSFQRTAIEIKTSRADWARDTYAKRRPWQRITHRFIYVVPAGLEPPNHVYGCGIWWVHEDGRIEIHRKARVNKHPEQLPQQVIQALAYRATPAMSN